MSFSPDGRWWWDGRAWVAATSADGKWRWNGADWAPTSGKASGPGWVRAVFGLGPIVAALGTAALFWVATNDTTTTLTKGVLTWIGLVFMRLVDPLLTPLWRVLAVIPGIIRGLGALAIAAWFSISQFGPDAYKQEIARFQLALYVSIAVAYALIRPGRGVEAKR